MLKKLHDDRPVFSWYAEAVMASQTHGVPCRSEVFRYGVKEHHLKCCKYIRADEVMEEKCERPCRNKGGGLLGLTTAVTKNALSPSGLKKLLFKEKKEEKKLLVVNETAGSTVQLKCPGTKPADEVVWVNNSHYLPGDELQNVTGGRVRVDAWGTLRISPTIGADRAFYMCVVEGKEKGHVFLNVTEPPRESEFRQYGRWVMWSFSPDFLVFVFLMWVKHKHRKRILISAEDALSQCSSDSDTNISTNACTRTIVDPRVVSSCSCVDENNSARSPVSTSSVSDSSHNSIATSPTTGDSDSSSSRSSDICMAGRSIIYSASDNSTRAVTIPGLDDRGNNYV
nr:hypothetical protein BaRGS_032760 [Batillaria attramentaria]